MKFILKLLLAPLMLVLWIVEWALTLALKASAVVCVIASALFLLSGFFYFVDGNVQNGCICLGIAFLQCPDRCSRSVVLHVTRFEQSGFPPVYISGYFPIIITVGNNQPALLTMQTAVLVGRFVNKLSIARIIFAIKPVLTVGFQVKFTAAGARITVIRYMQSFFPAVDVGLH